MACPSPSESPSTVGAAPRAVAQAPGEPGGMWKRVHLAVIDGPDCGHVIDLGATGRALPPGLAVTVGRGALVDQQILDPQLSRHQFRVWAGTDRLGRPGAWLAEPGRIRHLRIGGRHRVGGTTFELRTDFHARLPRSCLRVILPVVASLGFVAMWVIPGAGPWPMVLAALLTPAGMAAAARVQPPPLPDPARLLHAGAVATPAPPREGTWRVEVGNTRRRPLTLAPGDAVGFGGAGAHSMARWVTAQLRAHGATCAEATTPQTTSYTLTFPDGATLQVLAASEPTLLPAALTLALPAPGGHNRRVSTSWFAAATVPAGEHGLPAQASLRSHLPCRGPVQENWRSHDGRLRAPIGVVATTGAPTPLVIDLAGDSPHALIAGTTGAGKSELLTSWLLALALAYPPVHVSMVLIDYKGGATFGTLADLPHVLGVLTDLEHQHTTRVLASLRVEIHRRERLLRSSGTSNLTEHNLRTDSPLSRLLLVVDEFRVLAEEYPAVMDQLVRVAAQGRSLGIHVILATQRPGGAMTPDIRANMGLRVCLRVVEEADSIDLIGTTAAARLPAVPGRMVIRDDAVHTAQALLAGAEGADLLAACQQAADDEPALARTHRPWAPPLPTLVTDLPPARAGHIHLGVSDLPHEQRLGTWEIPLASSLLVAGESGSGRTNVARAAALEAMRAGHAVHVIGTEALIPQDSRGSFAHVADPAACHRLLRRISAPGRALTPTPDALIIDGVDRLVETVAEAVAPGEEVTFLAEVLRTCRAQGRFLLLATTLPAPSWLREGDQIVFPPHDPHTRALSGIDTRIEDPPAGRAVAVRGGKETVIQVVHVPAATTPGAVQVTPEFELRPLPTRVDLPLATRVPGEPGVCIGIGGTKNQPVCLPCAPEQVTLVLGEDGAGTAHLARVITSRAEAISHEARIAVVADIQFRSAAELDEAMAQLHAGSHVLVTATAEGLGASYHPLATRARQAEHTVFLGLMPRSVVGVVLGAYISPHVPGRAVVRARGAFTPVQIDLCRAARTASG